MVPLSPTERLSTLHERLEVRHPIVVLLLNPILGAFLRWKVRNFRVDRDTARVSCRWAPVQHPQDQLNAAPSMHMR